MLPLESRARPIDKGPELRTQCPRKEAGFKSGEGLEYCLAVHAEQNAVISAARLGIRVKGCVMFISGAPPCKSCASIMINAGIKIVYYVADTENYDEIAIKIFHQGQITVYQLKFDAETGLWYVPVYTYLEKKDIPLANKLTHNIKLCEVIAQKSRCMSRKVGAVIVSDDCIVSSGYNGNARGVVHCDVRTYGLPNNKEDK